MINVLPVAGDVRAEGAALHGGVCARRAEFDFEKKMVELFLVNKASPHPGHVCLDGAALRRGFRT